MEIAEYLDSARAKLGDVSDLPITSKQLFH